MQKALLSAVIAVGLAMTGSSAWASTFQVSCTGVPWTIGMSACSGSYTVPDTIGGIPTFMLGSGAGIARSGPLGEGTYGSGTSRTNSTYGIVGGAGGSGEARSSFADVVISMLPGYTPVSTVMGSINFNVRGSISADASKTGNRAGGAYGEGHHSLFVGTGDGGISTPFTTIDSGGLNLRAGVGNTPVTGAVDSYHIGLFGKIPWGISSSTVCLPGETLCQQVSISVNSLVTTKVFNFLVGTPFPLRVNSSSAAGGSGRLDDYGAPSEFYAASGTSDFLSTDTFAMVGPVFNLPTGFTVNSASAFIVDNHFTPTGAPEPASLLLMGVGLAGLRLWRLIGRG